MKKLLLFAFILTATVAFAQTKESNPKDLWTNSIDVSLGDNWRQKIISVPGKGEPNVVDFFRAFAKAYPCEYHDLLVMAFDGDKEVRFNGKKPHIRIDGDSCLLENGSFAMRVFYDNNQPVALGVCCHKAITTNLQEAYYYRYNKATRKLTPLALGSDFTGGIVKRRTAFSSNKNENAATMVHGWGRCELTDRLVWTNGKLELRNPTKENMELHYGRISPEALLLEVLDKYEMELGDPKPVIQTDDGIEVCGGSYNSLPICTAIRDPHSATDHYVAAATMEGFYYFTARGWDRADSTMLVAVYTECAPDMDFDFKQQTTDGHFYKTPHKLEAGDEVSLHFYLCDKSNMAIYLDPSSPTFKTIVGKGLPNLGHNEWRCVLSPDNDDLVFVSETDGQQIVFKWDGKTLKKQ